MGIKAQNGRSITEMLMTLAIIGIITVSTYAGFKVVLTRNHVNNLIEDVKLAGFVVVDGMFENMTIADNENDYEIQLVGKFTPKSSYSFSSFRETERTFAIIANDVPYDVCEQVKTKKVDWLEEIKPNGKDNICNENAKNPISFFFNIELIGNTEMKTAECRRDKDCSGDTPYCFEGYCAKCKVDSNCPSTAQYCRNGYCTKCETGMQVRNGECGTCPPGGTNYEATTADFCHTCGRNYLYGSTFCNTCNSISGSAASASREECKRCPNRCWDETEKKCFNSILGNPFNNNGICNYSCPSGEFVTIGNPRQCAKCPAHGIIYMVTTKEQCHSCKNTIFGSSGLCNACDSSSDSAKNISKTECERCTKRYWDLETSQCLLCPSGEQVTLDGYGCEVPDSDANQE